MHNPMNFLGKGQLVEKYLGTSYATVKAVADALPTLSETIERLAQPSATHAPVYTSTNANITLSGQPTIDGQLVPLGERILVKNQDDTRQNGIYIINGGDWERAADFMDSTEVLEGQIIVDRSVTDPESRTLWDINFDTDTYESGTSLVSFSPLIPEPAEKANYASLRTIVNPQHGDTYNVAGFEFLLGDSGGGKFYYNANMSRAMHNGGTILDPTNTADLSNFDDTQQIIWFTPGAVADLGCFVRIDDTSRVKADWFGANGTSANPDSRSIQAADDVSTGLVLLPAGTLNVSGINKSPQTFWKGAGIGSIGSEYGTELSLNSDTYIVQVSGNGTTVAGRGGISDVRLQGNIATYPNSDGISIIDGARQQYIERVYIRGFQDGLELVGTGEIYGTNLFINQCSFCLRALNVADSWFHETQLGTGFNFTGDQGYGLFMEDSNAVVFSSSRFQVSPVTGARIDNCEDIKFISPIVDQSSVYGIQILDSKRVSIVDPDIFDNGEVGDTAGGGIFIGSRAGNTTEDITILGGNIYNDGTGLAGRSQANGIWFSNQGTMNNVVINGTNINKNVVGALVNSDQVDGSLKLINTDLPSLTSDVGDANVTMLPETADTLIFASPLTVNRQVLLPAAGNYPGKTVRVIRMDTALDNKLFVRSNVSGSLLTLDALSTSGVTEFIFLDSTADWALISTSKTTVVNTLSELRGIRAVDNTLEYIVLGHTVAGLGGSSWVYDPSDTSSIDNNIDIVVTAEGARFKKLSRNSSTTLAEGGSIGDGVTNNRVNLVNLYDNSEAVLITPGEHLVTDGVLPITKETRGMGGTLKNTTAESVTNTVAFTVDSPLVTGLNIESSARSSALDYRSSDSIVSNSHITNSATAALSGRGLYINTASSNQLVTGNVIKGAKFGLLSDANHVGTGLVVVGNIGITEDGAPFNYNNPLETAGGVVHVGNYSELSPINNVSVPQLGIGIAGTQGGILGMSYIKNSGDDAIHTEDGHRNIVFSGLVADNCRRHGINSLATGQEGNVGKSSIFTGISMQGIAGSNVGINIPASVDNSQIDGTILTSIVAQDFEGIGMQLGDAVILADNNVLTGCPKAIRATRNTRQYGETYTDAPILVNAGKRSRTGIIHCTTPPTTLIEHDAGTLDIGGTLEGVDFAVPFSHAGGGVETTDIPSFSLTSKGMVMGNIFFTFGGDGNARGVYAANISWDGTTLVINNQVDNGAGYVSITSVNNAGVLAIELNSNLPTTDADSLFEFRGVYYAG